MGYPSNLNHYVVFLDEVFFDDEQGAMPWDDMSILQTEIIWFLEAALKKGSQVYVLTSIGNTWTENLESFKDVVYSKDPMYAAQSRVVGLGVESYSPQAINPLLDALSTHTTIITNRDLPERKTITLSDISDLHTRRPQPTPPLTYISRGYVAAKMFDGAESIDPKTLLMDTLPWELTKQPNIFDQDLYNALVALKETIEASSKTAQSSYAAWRRLLGYLLDLEGYCHEDVQNTKFLNESVGPHLKRKFYTTMNHSLAKASTRLLDIK